MYFNANILNQLGSPSINSNTFANRPAAGQTGRLFVSTDTFELYRDNGTGWDLIGGPGSSTVTGSGAAGQVTYWTGTNSVGGNNNLFWDSANSRLGIGTATPGTKLDVHTTAGAALQLNSTNAVGNIYSDYQNQGTTQYRVGYTDDADINYRRFGIYDSIGAKETITIDQQSRYVGINYQYSSLADQPQYTLDVSGSTRATDSSFFVTSGTGQVGINTTSPTQATALIEAVKTDGYGLFLNYATSTGSGSTATALWALNTTASSGFAAVIEEKTANTTGGQYPLLIKHSLSSGTAAAGMGTGLHFQLPDNAGTFKTTQLTVETTDAAAATYTTRYRFMAQVNATSTALAYLTSVGLGIGNVIPSYKLDVNGTVRAFGAGNTGNFLAVDTNVGGATVQLNPQYGTGLPILQSVGSFPLLFGTNSVEKMRLDVSGNLGLGTSSPVSRLDVFRASTNTIAFNEPQQRLVNTGTATVNQRVDLMMRWEDGTYNGSGGISMVRESSTARNGSLVFSSINSSGDATQAMTLFSTGNLAVGGTSDNGNRLQISGVGKFEVQSGATNNTAPTALIVANKTTGAHTSSLGSSLQFEFTNSGGAYSGGLISSVGGADPFTADLRFFYRNYGYTEALRITSSGLVGISTSAPDNLLTIQKDMTTSTAIPDNGVAGLVVRGSTSTLKRIGIGYDTTNNRGVIQAQITLTGPSPLLLNPDGGNLLIGTTTDGGAKLAVNGAASINTTTNGQFSKLNVAGGIHFNNNTDSTVSNEGSYGNAFAVRTLVTGGAPAYTIKSNTGSEGALYIISGLYSNKRFCDIVLGLGSSITPVVISNTAEANFPATRTYSVSGENLQLALSGSDTYAIYVTGFGSNEKS